MKDYIKKLEGIQTTYYERQRKESITEVQKREKYRRTLVWTENLSEGYTDQQHYNEALRSIDSKEIMNTPGTIKIAKQEDENGNTLFYCFHHCPREKKEFGKYVHH